MAAGPLHLPVTTTRLGQNRRKHGIRAVFRSVALVGLVACYGAYNYYDAGTFARRDPGFGSGELGGLGTNYPGFGGGTGGVGGGRRLLEDGGPIGGDADPCARDGGEVTRPGRFRRETGGRSDGRKIMDESLAVQAATEGNEEVFEASASEATENVFQGSQPVQVNRENKEVNESDIPPSQDTKPKTSKPQCSEMKRAEPKWFLVWYFIGVFYMFLALAIVCDEFFVPALEEMSSDRHLNLSMDVAGATLMAAGGSAPELFTSLIGTFQESSVGIGTIVGSAVFNVLFVIACCSLLSHEVLKLTWWPLFRDSTYYAFGLIVLAIFVGVNTPRQIDLWEAIVLLVMYLGYVLVMRFNRNIYRFLTKKELSDTGGVRDDDDDQGADTHTTPEAEENGTEENFQQENRQREGARLETQDSERSLGSTRSGYGQFVQTHDQPADFRWPGTFRAGVLKLLRDPHSWLETAGVGIVAKMAGDVDHVFRTIDANGDGEIDREELEKLFSHLDCHISREEMDSVFRELDTDGNGMISEQEFATWYVRSEERIKSKVKEMFDHFDADNSGTIDREEVRSLLEKLEPRVTEQDIDDAIAAMYKEGSREEITFDEFSEWYLHSLIYEEQKKKVDEEFEGVCENLKPPRGGSWFDYVKWIIVLPIVFTLLITVPDVSRPGWGKYCYLSFVVSIAWIGVYSFFMVDWAEVIGNTIGIPSVVMGLTFLAAGTSVPDLLSSVIVARKGEGDMAVSSSIGSNIFDILIGLPLPWIIFTAARGKSIEIGADNIWISIFVLLGMLVLIIVVIHCQGWHLTKYVGFMMFVFYILFLVLAIWLETPFEVCV